jgi:GNAT superfamily N-acetyltransferase
MDIVINPVSAENLGDFLHFFDDIAFTDNKHWAGCYCDFYNWDNSDADFSVHNAEQNRLSAVNHITEGRMNGYIAYHNGEPVGWCNANDKRSIKRLVTNKELWDEKEEKVCSIVCYIIAPDYRKQGIATKLLERVCADYTQKEYDYVEAYPFKGELTGAAEQYHGPMSMYNHLGFTMHKTLRQFDVVRKKLR